MNLSLPASLGFIYLISEVLLSVSRRARRGTTAGDANSFRLLWIAIALSIWAGLQTRAFWPGAMIANVILCERAGLILFVVGLILRWCSIVQLGRFFTVDVAIALDHQLIESGPYRFVRHPSYTGALLAFLGFGLTLRNWATLLVLMIPIALAFSYRIKVEERALRAALGERYVAYSRRTKRLLPFIY